MSVGLSDWIPVVAAVTPRALVSAEDLGRVARRVGSLPHGFGRGAFALERRLDLEQAGCDLLVCARDSSPLVQWDEAPPAVARLADLWQTELDARIEHAWLDFDLSGDGASSIWLAGEREALLAGLRVMRPGDGAVGEVARLLQVLEGRAGLRHLGSMTARPGQPVRVSLSVEWSRLPDVLRRTGRDVQVEAVRALQQAFAPSSSEVLLDLDLSSTETALELPCYPDGLARYLERLESSGLARPELARAALDVAGECHVGSHPQLWPESLDAWGAYVEGTRMSTLLHRPMLLKLRVTPQGWERPKIYVLYCHLWTEMQ